MPNWVSNTVTIKGTKKEMFNFFKKVNPKVKQVENWNDYVISLNSLKLTMRSWLPMPKTFVDWDTTNHMMSFDWYCMEDLKKLKKKYKTTTSRGYLNAMATLQAKYLEYVKGYKAAKRYQKQKYGVVGWYDYNCLTLGCKWNAQIEDFRVVAEEENVITIKCSMETPWSAPIPFLERMAKQFDLQFIIRSDEEGGFFDNAYHINEDYCIGEIADEFTKIYKKVKQDNPNESEDEQYEIAYVIYNEIREKLEYAVNDYVFNLKIAE